MEQQTRLRHLAEVEPDQAAVLLALLEVLDWLGCAGGPWRQRLLATWPPASIDSPEALVERLGTVPSGSEQPLAEQLSRLSRRSGRLRSQGEAVLAAARQRFATGWRIARWPDQWTVRPGCPRLVLLWGRHRGPPVPFWTAVFNSRKGKIPDSAAPWLGALRSLLADPLFTPGGWATSSGTLSYDLVASHARATGVPLLLVETDSRAASAPAVPSPGPVGTEHEPILVTCHLGGPACTRPTRMVCRDRMLAALSDRQVALEIRARGNLAQVLAEAQEQTPRPFWIFDSPTETAAAGGNRWLRARFPGANRLIVDPGPADPTADRDPVAAPSEPAGVATAKGLPGDYLYHYTRACPGHWPGQKVQNYHLDLIFNRSDCAHGAFDTLCRILQEERLRAGSRMVRGETAVICWSAHPYAELERFRRWRPGLVRWTVEPWGLAVRKGILRRLGAKPAIYLPPELFSRLRPADRYRYQRHEPPGCIWKQEREWRLAGDLDLTQLQPLEAFVMVPDAVAARELIRRVDCRFPVVAATVEP